MVKKLDENVWKKINLENQKKIDNHITEIYGKIGDDEDENYFYSSADGSNVSGSEFRISEDEENIYININEAKRII